MNHLVARVLGESCADSRRKETNRQDILRKLEAVRKKPGLSAHLAQMMTGPFGTIPSYAMEDPSCDWWASDEAEHLKQTLTDMLAPGSQYGIKPEIKRRSKMRPNDSHWPASADPFGKKHAGEMD